MLLTICKKKTELSGVPIIPAVLFYSKKVRLQTGQNHGRSSGVFQLTTTLPKN